MLERVKKHGKKYTASVKKTVLKPLAFEEAIKQAKQSSLTKFDGSVDAHIKLGIDLSKPEQNVRSTLDLPHGTGKKIRVIFFGPEAESAKALKAGATKAGLDDLVSEIEKGWLDFDVATAHPSVMPKISKIARILGPRGLMPSPKAGTIAEDAEKLVNEFKGGKVSFKNDKAGVVHISFGKVSFEDKKLLENLVAIFEAVKRVKPNGVKGKFILSASISPTMGLGAKLELGSYGA